MLSLKLYLDLLRLFLAAATQVDEDCFAWALSMSLPQTINSSGVNPTPFSKKKKKKKKKTPIPQLPNDYLSCCFGDTFSWHRYSSFYFYAGRAGKKVCSSFVFQPFSILFLCVPFLRVFLFSHDTAWVRWFRVFVGLKNGARWDCFFFGVLFYFGIIVDIFAELITPTAFLPHVLCGRGGNVCVLFR